MPGGWGENRDSHERIDPVCWVSLQISDQEGGVLGNGHSADSWWIPIVRLCADTSERLSFRETNPFRQNLRRFVASYTKNELTKWRSPQNL